MPGQHKLSYRVERNGGLINQNTGAKSDVLIEIPNSVYQNADASQEVKKMKIEGIDHTINIGTSSHFLSRNSVLVWVTCFFRQFGEFVTWDVTLHVIMGGITLR